MTVPTAPAAGEPIAEAWGDVVHDSIVAMDIQVGEAVTPSTASGVDTSNVSVVFPRPFATPPIVLAGSKSGSFIAVASNITTGGFTLTNSFRTQGTGSHGARTNQWIAYGPRA